MERYIKRNKRREEFQEKMVYSTEYMDWLEKFSSREPFNNFTTKTFTYSDLDIITKEEQEKVEDLEFLFEAINEYATENYIYPHKEEYGFYYIINYNDNSYKIGIDNGQATRFYVVRLSNKEEDALDYRHVMSSVKLPRTLIIDYKLEELSNLIKRLNEDNVPIEAIEDKTNEIFQKIKK